MRWLNRALASNSALDLNSCLPSTKLHLWYNTRFRQGVPLPCRTYFSCVIGGTARFGRHEELACTESAYRVTALHPGSPNYPTCMQQSTGNSVTCSTRWLRYCAIVRRKASNKPTSSAVDPPQQPSPAASTAAGFGAFSMLGLFGKRVILILGGKKVFFGLFSVVSLKKLFFLPAWIMVLSVSAGLTASYWASQADAPITGRKRPLLITESQEIDIGERAWHALQHQGVKLLPKHDEKARRCVRVGNEVVVALQLVLPQQKGREWIFSVAISSDSELEAYSMAPGFIIISEGLMRMCTTDAELAFVLAHEVAHVVARHVSERQSRFAFWGTLRHSLEQTLGISSDRQVLHLLLDLPLSRELEAEADDIALVLMSKACYNPQAASDVFSKMQHLKPAPLDWGQHWSTHPSFETRKARVQACVSRVMREAPCYHRGNLQVALTPNSEPVE